MELVERLWTLAQGHAPARVLVWVPDAISARWLTSLLVERGALVGLRVLDTEALLAAAIAELMGEALTPARILAEVRDALLADPDGHFARIAEHPSYQRSILRSFVELERGLLDSPSIDTLREDAGPRDRVLLDAFARFRRAVGNSEGASWWRGQAPRIVLEGHRRVPFLRRRAAAIAVGFDLPTSAAWERRLLDALGFERWPTALEQAGPGQAGPDSTPLQPDLTQRLSCAGPEAEIAEVARLLRADAGRPAVVFAPRDAIPRWVARLRHRDVPVRAWVERGAAATASAGAVRALLRVLMEPEAARRDDLELVLFGRALAPWADVAETLGLDYPRQPHPGDLREVWQRQRASSAALAGLAARVRGAMGPACEAVEERGRRYAWAPDQLEPRLARVRGAHEMVAAALSRLAELARGSLAELVALFEDWGLLARAAVHGVAGPELSAARVIVQRCKRVAADEDPSGAESSPGPDFTTLAVELDHGLAAASTGGWEQSRARGADGGPAVWVVPHASARCLGQLPERVFVTGLDAHPRPPLTHGPVSESLRAKLGLVPERERFTQELRALDGLVRAARGPVVGSWRHRDGAGARRPPGPWIAGRQDAERERAVGVDAIALPPLRGAKTRLRPSAPLEQDLIDWRTDPLLRRRVEAMRSHEAASLGPHTGALGVRVPPDRPYSASALQRYAALPYRYFIERVIGLREGRAASPTDGAAALLAREQGQVVHRALELAHTRRLAPGAGPLELASISAELLDDVLAVLAQGYEQRASHGQAEAIWASERDRWAVELRAWWLRWHQRLQAAYGPGARAEPGAGRSGARLRPEPEELMPGMFLLAAEWPVHETSESESESESESFELDLNLRSIPFVATLDRIELDPLRQRLMIVDYKSGRPPWASRLAAQLRAGTHLQLPLYALALTQIVARTPARLGLGGPVPVAALRLEYMQRPLARGNKEPQPEARAFSPYASLGVDAGGQVWSILGAAVSFTLAFVNAIEAGEFPLEARDPALTRGGFGRARRFDELARVVPESGERSSSLPPALRPLPDARAAREVVK